MVIITNKSLICIYSNRWCHALSVRFHYSTTDIDEDVSDSPSMHSYRYGVTLIVFAFSSTPHVQHHATAIISRDIIRNIECSINHFHQFPQCPGFQASFEIVKDSLPSPSYPQTDWEVGLETWVRLCNEMWFDVWGSWFANNSAKYWVGTTWHTLMTRLFPVSKRIPPPDAFHEWLFRNVLLVTSTWAKLMMVIAAPS